MLGSAAHHTEFAPHCTAETIPKRPHLKCNSKFRGMLIIFQGSRKKNVSLVPNINENPSKLAVYLRHKLKIQSIINKDDAYVRNHWGS